MTEEKLTEKQQAFVDHLFGDAQGCPYTALRMAGYSETSRLSVILKSPKLREAVTEATQMYMAMHGPKAAIAMTGLVDDPAQLGAQTKLAAAEKVLDRAGVGKTERLDISSTEGVGVFVLPAKDEDEGQ